ncbi:RicAFT regulatory complex protein RicA family protein [Longirhabdus pacifica]|uniref:RicAFT regulatory complex protein RicA family protein n=1 Tax=Longirhabdus pacifica TaxID=2305227 RepID=UPI001008B377|nr:YlbF family regulator [Longirhabdus pacifica]
MEQKEKQGECGMKKHQSINLVVREDIMASTKQLSALIGTSDEVIAYQQAEKKIQDNEHVQSLIQSIKKKQKELVGFEYFKNDDMIKKIEGEMQALENELDEIPLVQQFKQSQSDINYLLQLVVSIIKDSLAEKIQLEEDQPVSNS